jgi:3-hydroxybutyryl-CoA dehydrogenase
MCQKILVVGDGPLAEGLAAALADGTRAVTLYRMQAAGVGPPHVELVSDLAAGATGAALAIDTTVWPFETKREVTEALDRALPSDAILLTLAVAQPTTEIASWTDRAERVVGFSALPPFEESKLVELAGGLNSDAAAVEAVEQLFQAAGREVSRVRDDAGLVLARILCLIINEAASTLMEGVASARDIDTAMKLGGNYPRGPLEWADLLGIDFVYAVLWGLRLEQGEDRYRPSPFLRKMLLAGRLGRKTGRGFFEYGEEQRR